MSNRLADRLQAARLGRFVGRVPELELWRTVLAEDTLPWCVLHLFGPGGIGKTTLLRAFLQLCQTTGIDALYLDARNVEPTPRGFLQALRLGRGLDDAVPVEHIFTDEHRHVVLIDTYETLTPLDDWVRDHWLPHLPPDVLVVLASRNAPTVGWRVDPGWHTLLHILPLRNLSPDESCQYLAQHHLPITQRQRLVEWTHGHPLALSLVVDLWAQDQEREFQPERAPDIIKLLLEQLVQKVPSPVHRTALEACALVRVMTEALLSEMLALPDVHDIWDWLRTLSFIDAGPGGIFPHDLAREALVVDLRWRNPLWYAELHDRARHYYARLLQHTQGHMQQRLLFEYVYLHRDNPMLRPFFEWQETGGATPDGLRPTDIDALIGMVAHHEGVEAARWATFWFQRQAAQVVVFRDSTHQPAAFMLALVLNDANPNDLQDDPATRSVWSYLQQHAPLRPGERATFFRFWMARDTYQAVSALQSLLFVNMAQYYLNTPGLAFSFFACADPDFWAPSLGYVDLMRLPAADWEDGGRHYGVYGHDWRVTPPLAWLDLLAARELATTPIVAHPQPSAPLVVLSKEAFAAAVRALLHNWSRPDVVRDTPLLRARFVMERSAQHATDTERMATLRDAITQVMQLMQAAPREEKWYRALYHTYIRPAATQEVAAELLDVPFSSYRRHLKAGLERVTDILWDWEVQGPPAPVPPKE